MLTKQELEEAGLEDLPFDEGRSYSTDWEEEEWNSDFFIPSDEELDFEED